MEKADVFLFLGQSNMAGRGETCARFPQAAPAVIPGAGYEFRAVSDPERLYPLVEPFGATEDNPQGIDDCGMKTGSLVSAFVNAYYQGTGVSVVGVSASKGGSAIASWQPGTLYLNDALARLRACRAYLRSQEIAVRHTFVLFCQGEKDGDWHTPQAAYREQFLHTWETLCGAGVEHGFLVGIGEYNGKDRDCDYAAIRAVQEAIAAERTDWTVVSRAFATMRERGLMKDDFHYYQQAYNEVGTQSGQAAAAYVEALGRDEAARG